MFKQLTFLMCMFYSFIASGQSLNYTNVLCGHMSPYYLVSDNVGNIYLTGIVNDVIDFAPGPGYYAPPFAANHTTMFIAKYDSSGQFTWVFSLLIGDNGSSDVYPTAIAVDDSGNIYVTGSFSNSPVDMDPGPGVYNIYRWTYPYEDAYFFAKYSSSGQLIYAYSFGKRIQISDMVVDDLANVYLSGTTDGTDMDPGPDTVTVSVQGNDDRFILKLDSASNFIWVDIFNGASGAYWTRMTLDIDNNIIIGGTYVINQDFDPGPGTFYVGPFSAISLAKYDSSGAFIWAKPLSRYNTYIEKVETDPQNNIYLSGYLTGINNDFNPDTNSVYYLSSYGQEDAFLAKYTPSGDFIWAFNVGGPESDPCFDLEVDADGNSFMTGTLTSDSMDFDPGPGTSYFYPDDTVNQTNYTAVYNTNGQLLKMFGINGVHPSYPRLSKNALLPSNELVMTGAFEAPVDFDPGPGVTSSGSCSYGGFITKYGTQFLGLNSAPPSDNFSLFPNPADEQFTVRFDLQKPARVTISIFDVQGRKIKTLYDKLASTGPNATTFNIAEIPTGVYLINVQSGNARMVQKIIVL